MRALKIAYNDHQFFGRSSSSFTIHERNLKKLAIQIYKVNRGLSAQLAGENLNLEENH